MLLKLEKQFPPTPKTPKPIKNLIFTPAINNIAKILTTIIIPVPKSGCSIIRPKTVNKTIKIGITPFLISFKNLLLFDKYLAVKIMSPSFANSLG